MIKWQNVGSAPCYRPYRLAYRLTNPNSLLKTFVGKITVNKWMPGSIETFTDAFMKEPADLPPGPIIDVIDRIVLPNDMPAGVYRLAVGVVGEQTHEPVVQLGINGRNEDGWYPLSNIRISD